MVHYQSQTKMSSIALTPLQFRESTDHPGQSSILADRETEAQTG